MIDVNFFQVHTIQFFKYPFARAQVSSSLNQKSISFEIHFPFLILGRVHRRCSNTAKLDSVKRMSAP